MGGFSRHVLSVITLMARRSSRIRTREISIIQFMSMVMSYNHWWSAAKVCCKLAPVKQTQRIWLKILQVTSVCKYQLRCVGRLRSPSHPLATQWQGEKRRKTWGGGGYVGFGGYGGVWGVRGVRLLLLPPLTGSPHASPWFQCYLSITIDLEKIGRKHCTAKRGRKGRDSSRDSGRSQEFSLSGTIRPLSLWSLLLGKIPARENASSPELSVLSISRNQICLLSFQPE